MNKEQEQLARIYATEFVVKRLKRQTDEIIIFINKQKAIMDNLDNKNGFISSIRWIRAYKKYSKKLIEAKALSKLTKVQIDKWELLLADYDKNF